MVFVEVPLVAMFLTPGGVTTEIRRFHSWLKHYGWTLTAVLALVAGIYAIVKDIQALT